MLLVKGKAGFPWDMINCLVVLLLIVPLPFLSFLLFLPFLPILPFPSTLPHLISIIIIIIFNFSSFFFFFLISFPVVGGMGWWEKCPSILSFWRKSEFCWALATRGHCKSCCIPRLMLKPERKKKIKLIFFFLGNIQVLLLQLEGVYRQRIMSGSGNTFN